MSALFIVRTPLQAWIAESVMIRERCISFSIVYVTVDDSCEDRTSFERLSAKALSAWYVIAKRRRPDFFHQLELAFRLEVIRRTTSYRWDTVFLASFEAHGINALVRRIRPARIVGFDDGTANINLHGKYSADSMSKREQIYRQLLGGVSNRQFIGLVSKHYTIFGDYSHIMPSDRLVSLEPLVKKTSARSSHAVRYFVGQPLEDVLNQAQINRLEALLAEQFIDKYVKHPRERQLLNFGDNISLLDKKGQIAERAIDLDADGRDIWLYGWFSTVMFTLSPIASRRIVLLAHDDRKTSELASLAKKAGCEVFEF